MQLHQIKPKNIQKNKKRVGRGGKRGTYSGKGLKGQLARAGRKVRPDLRDFIKKIPKRRGYDFQSVYPKPQIVNLKDLEIKYQDGEIVSPETLIEKGLIAKVKGRMPEVKILGDGKLTKKLEIKDCRMSESVKMVFKIS